MPVSVKYPSFYLDNMYVIADGRGDFLSLGRDDRGRVRTLSVFFYRKHAEAEARRLRKNGYPHAEAVPLANALLVKWFGSYWRAHEILDRAWEAKR